MIIFLNGEKMKVVILTTEKLCYCLVSGYSSAMLFVPHQTTLFQTHIISGSNEACFPD